MALPYYVVGMTILDLQNGFPCRILLPEDCGCTNPDLHGYCFCTAHTGGDCLKGAVEIITAGYLDLIIEVRFEGLYREWTHGSTTSCSDTAEVLFLQEIDTKYRPPLTNAPAEIRIHQIPFSFIVPKTLIAPRSDMNSRFLSLYPSARLSAIHVSNATNKQLLQALIYYRLVATITERTTDSQRSFAKWKCEREVVINPLRPPDPPLYIEAYPDEFKLQSGIKLRRHLCGRSIGELDFLADEPNPINLLVSTPRASTFIPIEISWTSNGLTPSRVQPQDWTFVVQSRVRLHVFHSSKALQQEPTLDDVRKLSYLGVHIETTAEEVRYYSGLVWHVGSSLENGTATDSNHMHRTLWKTKLRAAVNVPKRCLPSFLAPTAALRYSVVLKFSLLGLWQSSASIVVPVQLYRYRSLSTEEYKPDWTSGVSEESWPDNGSDDTWECSNEPPPSYRS